MEKEFDAEALSRFDGKNGQPAYVAYRGRVIDVTGSRLWHGGIHMQRHLPGRDLTVDIGAAPHGPEMLERYPTVGVFKERRPGDRPMPGFLSSLLRRYPLLRRHPHPVMVHFPTVFMLSTTCFAVFYLLTGIKSFETTAFHCLGAGLLFTPLAIATGFFTWWLNYDARSMRPVIIKKALSLTMLPLAAAAFVWRILVPDILESLWGFGGLYFLIIVLPSPMVLIIGYYGGTLTFPTDKG